MAISLLGNTSFGPTDSTAVGGSYTCHAATTGNRKLIVWVAGEIAGGANVNSVTYNGVSLTKYREDDSGINPMAMFYLDEANFPTTPGSYTLTATFSTAVSPGFVMVLELDGAAQGDPSAYEFQALTTTNANNDSITTTADGSWICSLVCTGDPGTFTATSGQTLANQASGGGGGSAAGHGYEAIASASVQATNWSFSATANRFGQSSCCIEPAAAGTGVNIETSNIATGNGGASLSHTLTAEDNRIVLVFVADESTNHPSGVTYNGVAMTSVVQSTNTDSLGNASSIWAILDSSLPGSSGSYSVTVSGMDSGASVTCIEINNAAQVIPSGAQIDTNENTSSTTSTCTITAPSGDSTTFGIHCNGSGGLTLTPSGTDTTIRLFENDASSTDTVGAYSNHTTSGSKNLTETAGSWNRCSHAVANFSAYTAPVAGNNAAIIGAHF
jgi:hypothetical protein